MRINTLDLNLLLVLDALQRTHSVTLAGEQLCISQSGVSNALRRLRDAFSDELFVRTDNGMMPTPLAESMAEPIQAALQQIRQTIENRGCFDAASSTRHFRLALSDVGQVSLLPHLLSFFDKYAPNISLETVPLSRHGIAEQMSGGEIDLAIGVASPLGAGFFRRRFRSLRFVCVVSKDHPIIQGNISLEQFLRASFIEYEPAGGSYRHFREHADRLFEEKNIQRKVSVKMAYLSGIESIIASSDRIAVVTEALVTSMNLENKVQVLGLPFDIPTLDLTLQWHERINKDPAQVWLHKAVIQVVKNLGKDSIMPVNTGNSELSLALASSA
ncbi:LysR family transcriptional regulator [Emcibacter sp.]|uniref:LysR family transcriptional regulator n=1 Tax=Emcibacter sp. TaxID=1979954 RepID=UPI003A90191A